MRLLVSDINIVEKGHYLGFIQFILDRVKVLEGTYPDLEVRFHFNEEGRNLIKADSDMLSRISFQSDADKNSLRGRTAIVRHLSKMADEGKFDHILFMDLDQFQIPFFLVRPKTPFSGILFRPHHRIAATKKGMSARVSALVKREKKIFSERLLLHVRSLRNIFILNDSKGVSQLNTYHHTTAFSYIPDPVFAYPSGSGSAMEATGDHESVYRYLVFGSINGRKNIYNIIQAYAAADLKFSSELLIAGPAKAEFYNEMLAWTANVPTDTNYSKRVKIVNAFVSNEMMDHYFSISDVCLIIYKDFYGSSGLLGRACLHRLKIIGPNVGLLNDLITESGLGLVADPADINDIGRALKSIRNENVDNANLDAFYSVRSPDSFLSTIIQAITK